jgi:hypothetical protein
LPSSLTRFHSRALAQLCPPTCVGLRYGQPWEHLVGFLDTSFNRSASAEASTSLPSTFKRLEIIEDSKSSECAGQTATFNRRPVSTHMSQLNLTTAGAGILNLLSIVYAPRPRLRSRLTLGGRTFPRKPWVYGGQEFNLSYRYSCLHPHFLTLHRGFPHGFDALRTLPYQSILAN